MSPSDGPGGSAVIAQVTVAGDFTASVSAQGRSADGEDWQAAGITFSNSGGDAAPATCDAVPDAELVVPLTGEQDGVTVMGEAYLSEWGLHCDGVGDAITLDTGDYGADGSFTYSLWYSKSTCQVEGETSTGVWYWEYITSHIVGGNSGTYLANQGSAGGTDNMHIYMGCSQADQGSWWGFQDYATMTMGSETSFIRTILMDSTGHYTLTDMPLGDTSSVSGGEWTHLTFSMSTSGYIYALDGVTQPDSIMGQAGHNTANGNDYISNGNVFYPTPSSTSEALTGFEGFADIDLFLGAR